MPPRASAARAKTKKPAAKKPASAPPKAPRPSTLKSHEGEVDGLAISPDSSLAVSVDWTGAVCCWDLATAALRWKRKLSERKLTSAAFLPDGRVLIAGWAAELLLLDPRDAEPAPLRVPTDGKIVWDLGASPVGPHFALCTGNTRDGAHVVSGGLRGELFVASRDGARCGALDRAHTKNTRRLACTPDGTKLLTGSWDKTVRVWDLASIRALAR